MRVAIASSGLGHVSRGIEAWAEDLARALHERGSDVTLFKGGGEVRAPYERVIGCWQRESARARRAVKLLPTAIAWRLGLASGYGVEQTTFALGLIRHLRAESVDILHVQDPHVALIVQRARQLGLIRTRTILAHGTEEPDRFLKKIEYVQHLSPRHQDDCRARGTSRKSWTALPNFIDTERFHPGKGDALRDELGIPRDAMVVLTAAAIKRSHKRIDALIEEFGRLREVDPALPVWLVVAGGREQDTDELVALGRAKLGDRVRFLVRFPRERMPDLNRCADVFVLPSLKEMMPIALLEATASGLPCIVNRHPVLEWIVGPGGEAADLATPGTLALAMGRMLKDAKLRRSTGVLARRHCTRNFGEQAVVASILDYYRQVRGHPQKAPARSERPSVSVVIPTYNCGAWIAQAVESVLAQTTPADEVIVVDDGSTDDTRHKLAPYMDRIRYIAQANLGVAAARNAGIAQSSSELIAFLDADDVWHPRKLEIQVEAMSRDLELGMLGSGVYDWPTSRTPEPASSHSPTAPITVNWRRLAIKNCFTTSSVLVRRDVLERVGRFDTELRGPEDYDLWLRIAESARVAHLAVPLVGYRTVSGSLGRRAGTMEAGLLRILRKLDDRGAWGGRWLLRRRAHAYCSYSCAFLYAAAGDHRAALSRILRSLAAFPLPYRSSEVRFLFGRLRMLSMILRRLPGAQRTPA